MANSIPRSLVDAYSSHSYCNCYRCRWSPNSSQVDLLRRLPAISIVGLPDGAIRKCRSHPICHSKFWIPVSTKESSDKPSTRRTQKSGTMFDLPIAIAILQMDGQLDSSIDLSKCLIIGELALSGELRPIRGALSVALLAKSMGYEQPIFTDGQLRSVCDYTDQLHRMQNAM